TDQSETTWIRQINWIIDYISVKVRVSSIKINRILCRPPSNLRIIISCPEASEASVLVVETAREAEGLEAGVGVERDVAELVVVDPLRNRTSGSVDHQSRATEMIGDDPVRDAGLDQVIWHIGFAAVDEARDDIARTV